MSATGTSPKGSKTRPAAKKPQPKQRNLVLPIALGVVVLLGLVAIVVSRGGDDGDNAPGTDASGQSAEIEETRSVDISGVALADYKSGSDPAVGASAPVASGSTFAGEAMKIGEPGTPQLVFFLAHWCPHCQKEVPVITTWIDDTGMPAGIDLKAVSTGVNADAPNYPPSEWLDREGWPIDTLADDENSSAGNAYGLTAYPFFVAIDAEGKVVARASGELTPDQIDALVAAATS